MSAPIVDNKIMINRLPRGPTLTFKVHQFTLAKDVIACMRRQFVDEDAFKRAPLIIQNNFTGEGIHLKLMASTFQNIFPTINLATVNLSNIKRCVLISYNPITQLLDFRHYTVTVSPVGLSRRVKKVVVGKVPNLGKCDDIADFLTSVATDSEYEDDDEGHVVLPQTLKSRGNVENNKSEIKLHEIGPRLTVELIKIEDDLFTFEILYHKEVVKTEEEQAIKAQREEKKRLKLERKKVQSQNVDRKLNEKAKSSQKSIGNADEEDRQTDDDDDAAYYKDEVGEEPDKDLFSMSTTSRKRGYVLKYLQNKDAKKRKFNDEKTKGSGDKSQKFGRKEFTDQSKRVGEKSQKFGKNKAGQRQKHKTRKSK